MGEYTPNNPMEGLSQLIGAGNAANETLVRQNMANKQMQHQTELAKYQEDLKNQSANDKLQKLLSLTGGKLPEGAGISMGADAAAITRPAATGMVDLRKEALEQKGMADLSKRYEKVNGFLASLKDVEGLTDQSGKGGVVTNPEAKLISAGGLKSKVPDSIMGLGEMINLAPKGSTEERKSLQRLQLEYQKAMSGLRVTDQARNQEKAAMGWIASGDPNLVSKGVRSLAKNVRDGVRAIQGGYKQNVRDQVHSQYSDPLESLSNIYEDKPISQQQSGGSQTVAPANDGFDPNWIK